MKLIKKKVFKFFAFLLAGLTLATTATPFIVSCSKSAPNQEEDNNVVKQDYWWPKDVLIDDFSVGECIENYFTQKFRQYAPNSIKFIDLKSWFFPPSTYDERIGSLWFKDFNKLPVYANTEDYSSSIPDTDAILKNNPNKISYVDVYYGDFLVNYKDEINWYYKKTDQKLKAFKDDLEPTIPVYEVYANINLPWTISLVLYHEDLYKIDPVKYPASTIEISKRDFVSKHDVKLKFKVAIAQDADNLGQIYPGKDYYYIDNYLLKKRINQLESGDPNYKNHLMMEIMIDSYKNILNYLNNNLISPSLLGDENFIYWENNAIGAFNKSINKIMDKYKEIPQYTKNKLIKPNEILN